MENKPTDKQIALLAKWGKFTPGMSKADAHKIISEHFGTPTDVTNQYQPTSIKQDNDERRQRLIVRQNALGNAIALIGQKENSFDYKAVMSTVFEMAEQFENWVFR